MERISRRQGPQAIFAPVIKFILSDFDKIWPILKPNKRKSILLIDKKSIGADLQGQNGGERMQVVENDLIERRCSNKLDVF